MCQWLAKTLYSRGHSISKTEPVLIGFQGNVKQQVVALNSQTSSIHSSEEKKVRFVFIVRRS